MEIKDLITDTELQECLKLVEDKEANHDCIEDKEIICKSCGKTFTFTIGAQEFYKSKNFPAPKRCRKCAKKRRMRFLNYK